MSVPEQQPGVQSDGSGTPGLIDTLGNGFALLNRRPYLVWLPVLLDLLLWTGFRISIVVPVGWIESQSGTAATGVAETVQQMRDALASTELVHLIGGLTPMLISDLGLENVSDLNLLSAVDVAGSSGWLLLFLGGILMVFTGVSYLTMIGRLIVDSPAWGLRFFKDCVSNSLRLAGVVLAVVAFVALMFAPFAVLGLGLYAVGIDITAVLAGLGLVMLVWAFVFFFFSAHAITVDRASAFDAMRASYALVHRHLLSVLGLLLIVLVIRLGTPIALQVFTETRWGVPFAIVVNAYVATGLIAATMLYFKNRSSTLLMKPAGASPSGTSR